VRNRCLQPVAKPVSFFDTNSLGVTDALTFAEPDVYTHIHADADAHTRAYNHCGPNADTDTDRRGLER
jgi:hypothetical protein